MTGSVFTLEALNAAHGDALLLHYGPSDKPRLIVVDGGPAGVYKASLSPRLNGIRSKRGGGTLEIRMVIVSHIDDDHVTGILDFTKDLLEAKNNKSDLPFDVLTLWHNSFDDIVAQAGAKAASVIHATKLPQGPQGGEAILASVKQGRQLRLDADDLAINMNSGFDDLIQFDAKQVKRLNMGAGLTFTVLGPRRAELDALEGKWEKEVKALLAKKAKAKKGGKKKGGGASIDGAQLSAADYQAIAADYVDESIHNLSSIVVLVEFAGKRILLTGDARGDFILESLKEAGLLTNGRCSVDIFKVPHHGSFRNAESSLFETIVAKHYVFSANGRDGNPDPPTFGLLFSARPTGSYEIWLTNEVAAASKYIKKNKPKGVKVHTRADRESSVLIELGDPVSV